MRKKLVESSLGCKTTETTARRIDAILPTIPQECRTLRRKAVSGAATDIQPESRTDISYITTGSVDRDGEIVEPQGFELDDYRANPVVLMGHDPDRAIGKCLWIKPDEKGLIAKTLYPERPARHEGEWLPDTVFGLVAADVLRGKSVGFLPLDIRDPTADEAAQWPDLQRVITRALLIEYSVVSIPCNPEALVAAVGKGLALPWTWQVVGRVKPKQAPRPDPMKQMADQLRRLRLSPEQIAERAVKQVLSRWEV